MENDALLNGKLFEASLTERLLRIGLSLRQAHLAEDPENVVEVTLAINKLIYISKSTVDEVTLDNLDDKSIPKMVEQDLHLPFTVNKESFDPLNNVKIRVVAKNDWWRVDWETGKLIYEDAEPAYVKKIILNVHGGSWTGGCSGEQLDISSRYSDALDYPVFAVDYRLAPNFMFPCAISDILQAYLWFTFYAEKYLQLRFDEIIIDGDSAGGNISVAMVALLIQKNLQVPKGMNLFYPCSSADRQSFAPSLWIGLDDIMLNYLYLPFILNVYTEQKHETHKLATVKSLEDDILKKFPPMKIILAESDPLRDEILRLIVRLLKNDVKVETKIFKHQLHGFSGHAWFPNELIMKNVGLQTAIDNINSDF
jgi:acetyl esterase